VTWIVGCDTGGTFTDVFALSDEGEARVAKVPSTPPNFDVGVVEGLGRLGIPPDEVVTLFHGTTVTTNAVVTKQGAPAALLTTSGFRDILEIRRSNREELYDILWDPPPPLIPRRHRLEVEERVDYSGAVVTPLVEDSVRLAARKIRARRLSSVAVCFLNAHMNSAHERRAREILLEEIPNIHVSISTDVLPEPPEFERTSVTVANAYCAPVLRQYMDALEDRLASAGFTKDIVLVMHNGGGTMTTDYARGVPVKTLNSGPAAGVIAGAAIGSACGRQNVVCLDMGGTSADIAVIRDGQPQLTMGFDLEWGMPLRFPSIDVMSIGSGGGSIAWLDPAGYPRSGPRSAGAAPGPACYGKGGTEPTNTDAHLVLGRLSNDLFLDGRMGIDVESAADAIRRTIAQPLGLDLEQAAAGVLRIANASMVKAIRLMTVERGIDPREFSLIAFGGAGPLHALDLARELQMPEVIIPPFPGVTSAMGLLFVDPLDDFSRGFVCAEDKLDIARLQAIVSEMDERVVKNLLLQGIERSKINLEHSVDLRYIGQLHSVTVPIEDVSAHGLDSAVRRFHEEHLRQYRYSHPDDLVETSTLRVTARAERERPNLQTVRFREHQREPLPDREREVYFDDRGWTISRVVDRNSLSSGQHLRGPCVVEELDSTVVLPPGVTAMVDEARYLIIANDEKNGEFACEQL